MPLVTLSLPDVHETVGRPVVMQAAAQIMKLTDIPDTIRIYYKGKSASVATPGTQLDTKENREALHPNRRTILVEATEEYSMEDIRSIRSTYDDSVPVFRDTETGVFIRPIYVTSKIMLNFKFRTHSETEARRWISDVMVRTDKGRVINIHSLAYTYPIPYQALGLLKSVYSNRERIDGYGQSFAEYFQSCASSRLSVVANRTDYQDQTHTLVVRERQGRIQGSFEFIGTAAEPTKDNNAALWEVSFDYQFTYDRPEQLLLEYPIVVHNKPLPSIYTGEDDEDEDPEIRPSFRSNDMEMLSMFEAGSEPTARPVPAYPVLPPWDHYKPKVFPYATASVFQALVAVEETQRKNLLDLRDLGDYALDQDILAFLYDEIPYLTKLYSSFYHLTLYQNDEIFLAEKTEVVAPLQFRAKEPLDLRKMHRVRLSVIEDISLLDWDAVVRLKKHPKAFYKTVSLINQYLRYNPDFQKRYNRNELEDWELEYVWWVIRGGKGLPDLPEGTWREFEKKITQEEYRKWASTFKLIPKTVQTSWIIARRAESM